MNVEQPRLSFAQDELTPRCVLHFEGPRDDPEKDARLTGQHERIKALMLDGRWRTLREIAELTGYPEGSISAQLRHLRKERFGSYIVNREHVGHGLYRYQVLPPEQGF